MQVGTPMAGFHFAGEIKKCGIKSESVKSCFWRGSGAPIPPGALDLMGQRLCPGRVEADAFSRPDEWRAAATAAWFPMR